MHAYTYIYLTDDCVNVYEITKVWDEFVGTISLTKCLKKSPLAIHLVSIYM